MHWEAASTYSFPPDPLELLVSPQSRPFSSASSSFSFPVPFLLPQLPSSSTSASHTEAVDGLPSPVRRRCASDPSNGSFLNVDRCGCQLSTDIHGRPSPSHFPWIPSSAITAHLRHRPFRSQFRLSLEGNPTPRHELNLEEIRDHDIDCCPCV